MPRDLEAIAKEDSIQGMPPITKSPETMEESNRPTLIDLDDEEHMINQLSQRNEKRDELHPYTQTLKESDIESCVKLEEATFPENERCTREKFQYRLKTCGELSLGIFTSSDDSTILTSATSAPVYSGAPERKAVLLGHIVATKTTNASVTDDDMAIPSTSGTTATTPAPAEPTDGNAAAPRVGHKEDGRTICIHSLAVLPDYQRKGLGKTLMKAYIQRMESHGVADRAALIAHKELIPYYEALGFENLGESKAQFGGGGWYDMVRELKGEGESSGEDNDGAEF